MSRQLLRHLVIFCIAPQVFVSAVVTVLSVGGTTGPEALVMAVATLAGLAWIAVGIVVAKRKMP